MELFITIALIIGLFVVLWFFIKVTTDDYNNLDGFEFDKENIEKTKKILKDIAEKLRLKEIFVMTLGEIFKFIQELPSRTARVSWNVRKELMLIMLMGVIFYSVHLIGYTFTPYIVTVLIAFVIFGLRKSGHLKNSETEVEKEQEKAETPDYENMSDIQVGVEMAKIYLKKVYDLSIGATIKFIISSSTRQGRNNLLLEQELVLAGLLTVPYVYFGWAAFKITLIIIAGDYFIELLRGKRASYEEVKAELDEKNVKLTRTVSEVESLKKELSEVKNTEKLDKKLKELGDQVMILNADKEELSKKIATLKEGALNIIEGNGNKAQKLEALKNLVDQLDS